MARIGVFVCWCGENIARTVDVEQVAAVAGELPGVACAMTCKYMCSEPGQAAIRQKIAEEHLTGVVVASCSPHMHLRTFRKAAEKEGLNPYLVEMANIREQCSWVHHDRRQATAKAIDLVSMSVAKTRYNHALAPIEIPLTRRALVIGGGVAGIQAALDIADAGYQVVLVEREPSIGGKMAGLSETFPTLDCSQCILTPRMVEAGQHPNITLHTYSEIESVEGFVGNFRVTVRKKARYIDMAKCTGCGQCWNSCPSKKNPSAFDYGLGQRTAIYIPFPQAVPARPVIDSAACLKLTKGKCGICAKKCQAGAIRFDDEDRLVTEEVGAIVVATGYKLYSVGTGAAQRPRDRLRRIWLRPLCRRDRLAAIRAAALGLRPHGRRGSPAFRRQGAAERWSSSVASAPATTPRAFPTARRSAACTTPSTRCSTSTRCTRAQAHVFYMDIRSGGKNYDEFVRRAIEQDGAHYHRGRVSKIVEQDGQLIVRGVDTLAGEPRDDSRRPGRAGGGHVPVRRRRGAGPEAQRRLRRERLPFRIAPQAAAGRNQRGGRLCLRGLPGAQGHPRVGQPGHGGGGQGAGDVQPPATVARAGSRAGRRNELRGLFRLRSGVSLRRDRAGRDPRPQGATRQTHRPGQSRACAWAAAPAWPCVLRRAPTWPAFPNNRSTPWWRAWYERT